MQIAIISDIHSNLAALEAVLEAIGKVDAIWNLGDTIGYGPHPNECMALMRQQAQVMIAGNHDLACIGAVPLDDFNTDARIANSWNGKQLDPDHRAFLEALPPSRSIDERFTLAHGSPRDPVWEYLLSRDQAEQNFDMFLQQVCFIGHSHVPLVVARRPDGRIEGPVHAGDSKPLPLHRHYRYFINPGSVGQPRDQDWRAAYALLDLAANTVTWHRVEYDVAATQRDMEQAGLPRLLVARLEHGI